MKEREGNDMAFRYFLGEESELFSFVKIPKIFFCDKRFEPLSYGAKILYGLLLDRMGLSKKNQWYDDRGRVYVICTIGKIQEDFAVSKTVAVRFMKELEDFGLVEKKRRPNAAAMIYVKNFILPDMEEEEKMQENSGIPSDGLPEVQNREVQNPDFQKNTELSGSPKSGLPKHGLPEVQKMESNKTDKNKTNKMISSSSGFEFEAEEDMEGMMKEKINYSGIITAGYDKELADAMLESLAELFRSGRQKLKINGMTLPVRQAKEKIWDNMTERSFCLILENIRGSGLEAVYNLQNYLVACFYNLVLLDKGQNPEKRQKESGGFEQRRYDFKTLEDRLLGISAGESG